MNPKWIFERGVFDHGTPERMAAIVKELGMEAVEVVFSESSESFKGILDVKKQKPLPFGNDDCVLMYGCISLARYLMRNRAWVPGVWFDAEALSCQKYLTHWGKFSIHDNYSMMPLAEVKRQLDSLVYRYGNIDDEIFIRPDSQLKQFAGQLVQAQGFEKFWSEAMIYGDPSTLSLVSHPQKIRHEWRCIVANREFITASQYIRNGAVDISPDCPEGVAEYVERIATSTEWQPHEMYCMDICELEPHPKYSEHVITHYRMADGDPEPRYRLMEIGSVNTCGLYDCNLKAIIKCASEIATKEWKEIHS